MKFSKNVKASIDFLNFSWYNALFFESPKTEEAGKILISCSLKY